MNGRLGHFDGAGAFREQLEERRRADASENSTGICVDGHHGFADSVAHEPSRSVGDFVLPLISTAAIPFLFAPISKMTNSHTRIGALVPCIPQRATAGRSYLASPAGAVRE